MSDIILKINDNKYECKYSKTNFSNIAINDKIFNIELLKKISDNVFSFSVNQKLAQVELDFDEDGNLNIGLDGMNYSVEVTNATKELLEKFISNSAASGAEAKRVVKAPMPGLVVKSFVEEGDHIMQGDKLLIVEAMKMENVLKAPISGRVNKIFVKSGTPINKDEILVEIVND